MRETKEEPRVKRAFLFFSKQVNDFYIIIFRRHTHHHPRIEARVQRHRRRMHDPIRSKYAHHPLMVLCTSLSLSSSAMRVSSLFFLVSFLVSSLLQFFPTAKAQFGMPGMGGGKNKPAFRAIKSDSKLIHCEVCQKIAQIAFETGKRVREEKGDKLTEVDVIEEMESMCDESDDKTMWAVQNDLKVNFRNKLVLKFMGDDVYSSCETTCKTMLKACEDVMEGRDTDLAEILFKNRIKTAKGIEEWLCKEETESCSKKAKSVSKTRKPLPEFKKKEKKDIDTERMMGKLKNMPGMPGMQMFNRDDMMGMGGMGGGDDDYDDDDEGGDYGDYGGGDYGDAMPSEEDEEDEDEEDEVGTFNSAVDDDEGSDNDEIGQEGTEEVPVTKGNEKEQGGGGLFSKVSGAFNRFRGGNEKEL